MPKPVFLPVPGSQDNLPPHLAFGVLGSLAETLICLQITESMGPKFQLMNRAVENLRDAVEDAFDKEQTFRRAEPGFDQYEPCCDVTDLSLHSGFPNVSASTHNAWSGTFS